MGMLIVCCNPFSPYIQGFLHFLVMQSFQTQTGWICVSVHLGLEFHKCFTAVLSLLPPSWTAAGHARTGIWGLLQFPSAWVGAWAQDLQCKAKPKTSSLGHMLILCQGSVEGLLVQRAVGVAQRRHRRSSCYWIDLMGSSSFLLQWQGG